jgi:hypothetical protein
MAAPAPAPAPRKKIVPTLVSVAPDAAPVATFKEKKNPLENTADLIAMRYGISEEAPKIDESMFEKNRNIGKKVVPLKEYFKQAATEFVQKEAEKKEEAIQKKRENAKLTPCQRKSNTLQRNIDGYIKTCDRNFSNEAIIEMVDKAREKAARASVKATKGTKGTKGRKRAVKFTPSRTSSSSKKGGRTRKARRY